MVEYPNTFEGVNTQNLTTSLTNLTAVAVGFIPKYPLRNMVMTEFVGTGIILSILNAGLTQYWLRPGPGARSGPFGFDTSWLATCAVNSFVYTITTVMMGTSSAIFNPAVLFAWAILGRVEWTRWVVLIFAQLAGCIAGVLCAWSQFTQNLNRVPIPRRDAQTGKFLWMQVSFQWKWAIFREEKVWGPNERPWFTTRAPLPLDNFHSTWGDPEYSVDDPGVGASASKGGSEDGEALKPAAADVAEGELSQVARLWLAAGWTAEEAALAASPEFQAELRADRRRKLLCYCEVPLYYSPCFINCWWPHICAGTTLCHWLSFMTGNATQLTNTNMYLTQPVSAPGSNYAFLNAVLLAWLVGLAYFLLTASASGICTLQLNPAVDLGSRICHFFLPIPNKGRSGWGYSWVPTLFPFVGAVLGAGLMYMGMWSHLYHTTAPCLAGTDCSLPALWLLSVIRIPSWMSVLTSWGVKGWRICANRVRF